MCGRRALFAAAAAGLSVVCSNADVTRPARPRGDLVFTIDATRRWPISRFIYGANFLTDSAAWGGVTPPRELTLNRIGGNRLSAYNWETNFSNAGRDLRFQNDSYLAASTTPGEAIRARATASFTRDAGLLVTIPMLGWVAANNLQMPLDTSDVDRPRRLASHFKLSLPAKGTPFSPVPDPSDAVVYQDEFVHWLLTALPSARSNARTPIFFALDNEPDAWHFTHKEIQSDIGDDPRRPRVQTYAGFAATTVDYARAIKRVYPQATIFGPSTATYVGMVSLGRYANGTWRDDPDFGRENALDVYLDLMRDAERRYGTRLLDVLDVHWYPMTGTQSYAITNDYAAATDTARLSAIRVQAPRALWDAEYADPNSWVVAANGGPVQLLRRLETQIAQHYPGTKIAITEYYYGRAGDLSGGIAQADVLGIFGREGVYAAALWPTARIDAPLYGGSGARAYAYAFGAFRMYLDYDGRGGRFGDTAVAASTSDPASTSVYGSVDDAGRLVLVLINKAPEAQPAVIRVRASFALGSGESYTLTSASPSPRPGVACSKRKGDCVIGADNVVRYVMPAMSVTTLVLRR